MFCQPGTGPQALGRVGPGDFWKFVLIHYMCLLQYQLLLTLLSSPLATLRAPAVLQNVTATAVKGVVAMLQDYIQLSEGKNAHGHTHTDSMLTSILLSSDKGIINIVGRTVDKNTLTHVQIGAISQTYSHAHENTYSNCLYMCVCVCLFCLC